MSYMRLVEILNYLKNKGINKKDASSYIDLDSDQYLDKSMLINALDKVYGRDK